MVGSKIKNSINHGISSWMNISICTSWLPLILIFMGTMWMNQIDTWTHRGCVTGNKPGSFIMGCKHVYSLLWGEILSLSSKASAEQMSMRNRLKWRQSVPLIARHAEMQDTNEEMSLNTRLTNVDEFGGANCSDSAEQQYQQWVHQISLAALFSALTLVAMSPNLILGPIQS